MHQKRNRKMVSCDLASFPMKKECKNLMPHWCSEHQGRRSLGSEPQQSRSPSVSIPTPASARDDDSSRQHTVISKEAKMTNAAPHTSFRRQRSGVKKSHDPMVQRAWSQKTLPPPASAGDDPWADRFPEKSHKKAPREGELFRYFRLLRLLLFWCGSTEVQRHRPGWSRQ